MNFLSKLRANSEQNIMSEFVELTYNGHEVLGETYNCGAEFSIRKGCSKLVKRGMAEQVCRDFPDSFTISKSKGISIPEKKAEKVVENIVDNKSALPYQDSRDKKLEIIQPSKRATKYPIEQIELSIVMGTWNRKELLENCINSIRKAVSVPYEIVVVDGGSKDGTKGYLKKEYDITLVEEDCLRGAVAAFNNGFAISNGKYCVNLNDDITVEGGTLDKAWKFMELHPEIGQGCFYLERGDGEGRVYKTFGNNYYANFGITRKHIGDDVGWWGTEYQTYAGDTDLSLKIINKGWKVAPIEGTLIRDLQEKDLLREINNSFTNGKGDHQDSLRFREKWKYRYLVDKPLSKLHFGCGNKRLNNWINIDLNKTNATDEVMNLRNPDFPSEFADEIYACNILEHFYETETDQILIKWKNILKNGGRLRISVPEIYRICKHRIELQDDGTNYNVAIFGNWEREGKGLEHVHKQVFEKKRLIKKLGDLGFNKIKEWNANSIEEIYKLSDDSKSPVCLNLVCEK